MSRRGSGATLSRVISVLSHLSVFGASALAVRATVDAVTTTWTAGLTTPLIAVLVGALLGGWLASRERGTVALLIGLSGLVAVLVGDTFTSIEVFGASALWGLPHLLAGIVLAVIGVRAVVSRGLVACWFAGLVVTPLASSWLIQHTVGHLFVWIGIAALLATVVTLAAVRLTLSTAPTSTPFTSTTSTPAPPATNLKTLQQLLLGVAAVTAAGPLVQPQHPTKDTHLAVLYCVLLVVAAFTLYTAGHLVLPGLAGIVMLGTVLVGTAYQVTVQLVQAQVSGVAGVFAIAGLVGAGAAVAGVYASVAVRRVVLLAGPAVAWLGLLGTLAVGNSPLLALWSVTVIAAGVGTTLGAGLPTAAITAAIPTSTRTSAVLAGGLLVVSVIAGLKLGQGLRVLAMLTGRTSSDMAPYWFVSCSLVIAMTGLVGYRSRKAV
ncbi:MAG: hypothetical protein H0T78_05255 [Longispora sp.]|nr:hypothetical protein [Longispora sp. (in: high G+C Gram-positive bacteria)]